MVWSWMPRPKSTWTVSSRLASLSSGESAKVTLWPHYFLSSLPNRSWSSWISTVAAERFLVFRLLGKTSSYISSLLMMLAYSFRILLRNFSVHGLPFRYMKTFWDVIWMWENLWLSPFRIPYLKPGTRLQGAKYLEKMTPVSTWAASLASTSCPRMKWTSCLVKFANVSAIGLTICCLLLGRLFFFDTFCGPSLFTTLCPWLLTLLAIAC